MAESQPQILIAITPCMLICTLVHIADVSATLQDFVMIEYMIQILQITLFGLGKALTPIESRKPKSTPIVFDVGVGSRST